MNSPPALYSFNPIDTLLFNLFFNLFSEAHNKGKEHLKKESRNKSPPQKVSILDTEEFLGNIGKTQEFWISFKL